MATSGGRPAIRVYTFLRSVEAPGRRMGSTVARTFRTLEFARRYAWKQVGRHPELLETRAFRRIEGRTTQWELTVKGATLLDLFPPPPSVAPKPVSELHRWPWGEVDDGPLASILDEF